MQRVSTTLRLLALGLMTTLAVSCGSQPELPEINGVKGPFFNVQDGKVLISTTFETLELVGGGRFPISKMPGSYFELAPAQFGGTLMQVYLDVGDIDSTDWGLVDPTTLPGGRPLPGIVGGKLPSIAMQVEELNDATFYVSKQVFGFFMPFKVDASGAILTFRLNMEGKHVGNISVVGNDQSGENGGILLLMNLNKDGKARLKKLIEYSKRRENKGKIF